MSWPPRHLTPLNKAFVENGDGEFAVEFAETFGSIGKDGIAGKRGQTLQFRDWQKELTKAVYARDANGDLCYQVLLIGEPRKNGKSAWASSAIALFKLFAEGVNGAEIIIAAAEKDQARIIFEDCKRMVQDSELNDLCQIFKDSIYVPSSGNVMKVVSAEAYSKEGYNPSTVIIDELHAHKDRSLFDVFSLAMGNRGKVGQLYCVTTAGVKSDSSGQDSIAYSLYQYGKQVASGEVIDPNFFMAWWEAAPEADHRLPETWQDANPGFNDLVSEADFASAVKRTPEAEFRTKRLNQWVNSKTAWLPAGAWAELEEVFELQPNDEYVLGFDGSWNNDSTSLVAVILPKDEDDHYRGLRVNSWEKNFATDDDSWVVDKGEVTQFIFSFFDQFPNCREMACDPSYWEDQMYLWQDYGLPVVEYRNSPQRTIPATSKLFEAIMSKKLTHNGDAALARHIDNCILKMDGGRGARITKDYRNPKLKVDNAIALMMAYDRAEVIASGRMETTAIPEFFG